jgi:hypothetical protein
MSNMFAYYVFLCYLDTSIQLLVKLVFHDLQRVFEQCSSNCIHSHDRMSLTERKKRYLKF